MEQIGAAAQRALTVTTPETDQSATDSTRSRTSLTSANADVALRYGQKAATRILTRYPDYGKASKEYVAGIVEALARYPIETLRALVDVTNGVSGRCKFLPTIADIVEIAEIVKPAAPVRPTVVVIEHSPEWEAWRKVSPRGIPVIDIRLETGEIVRGWRFPSLLPERISE